MFENIPEELEWHKKRVRWLDEELEKYKTAYEKLAIRANQLEQIVGKISLLLREDILRANKTQ